MRLIDDLLFNKFKICNIGGTNNGINAIWIGMRFCENTAIDKQNQNNQYLPKCSTIILSLFLHKP